MPILTIDAVEHPDHPLPAGAAQLIADAAGEVLGSQPGRTRVTIRRIPRSDYAENEVDNPPAPLMVSLRLRRDPFFSYERKWEARDLTAAIAKAAGRPLEHVHLFYEPAAFRRQAFGVWRRVLLARESFVPDPTQGCHCAGVRRRQNLSRRNRTCA